eukprot:TRINITY_DN33413_c0_g1_i1.p1 TRINITY_DN33413_c0_g1~~TRINITY_DN33413_c0_g1_i1.p1  ORF type:complete len:239 (+),score=39.54 TRINITY_DN33413_c0_g1_i1:25-717(+)
MADLPGGGFSRMKVLQSLEESGIIPVFCHHDITVAKQVLDACAAAGLRTFEWTNRGTFAYPVFLQLIEYARSAHPEFMLGVGSIVDAPTAALFIAAGASFIVGPCFDKDTALLCNKRKIAYSPGCATATEIHNAHEYGVELVKVFPGSAPGGPSFVKSVLAPMPWTRIMPTGGVDPSKESLLEWFKAGIVCAGIGSKLITPEIIAQSDYAKLTERIRECRQWIAEARQKK